MPEMKFFHTADWHLGKLVHGVYMTEDQEYILERFMEDIERERPDAVVIAGDLYDRAVPPAEAVQLLNRVLSRIVLQLHIPVLAIAGNHDSPSRLHFGSGIMKSAGFHLVGEPEFPLEPVRLRDAYGDVHFHLIPYADPGKIRYLLDDETIRTHDDAMRAIVEHLKPHMDPSARHVLVGHAFVTPEGSPADNTSDAERPLAIGGAEHVSAEHFAPFHYTALGHLHQAHCIKNETIQYAGSPLKYSISEEHHRKGYLSVELDADGQVRVEKRTLAPLRDMRTIEGKLADIERHAPSDDYVFVQLLDETAVLHPMERVRTVYPNAMHVQRKHMPVPARAERTAAGGENRSRMDELSLFRAFCREIKGAEADAGTEALFLDVLQHVLGKEGERSEADSLDDDRIRAV
jgi:exonuclease SbcD